MRGVTTCSQRSQYTNGGSKAPSAPSAPRWLVRMNFLGLAIDATQVLGHQIEHFRRGHQIATLRIAPRVLDHVAGSGGGGIVRREAGASALMPAAELAGYRADVAFATLGDDDGATHWPPPIPTSPPHRRRSEIMPDDRHDRPDRSLHPDHTQA